MTKKKSSESKFKERKEELSADVKILEGALEELTTPLPRSVSPFLRSVEKESESAGNKTAKV